MFNQYFIQEKENLNQIGAAFSTVNPTLSQYLKYASGDPDVERLLEGVAFLSAMLRQKLDDDFPEIIHDLIQLIWPHYLRPLPSSTIIAFKPKKTFRQTQSVSKGTYIDSIPVQISDDDDDEKPTCTYQTCSNVIVYPLEIVNAIFKNPAGKSPYVKVCIKLNGISLNDLNTNSLRFFLSGDYRHTSNLFFTLLRFCKRIEIRSADNENTYILKPEEALKPVAFSDNEEMIPFPINSFSGFRLIQEYFLFSEAFLFIDLIGLENWKDRGDGDSFDIYFVLNELPFDIKVDINTFVLYASTAINVYDSFADTIIIDHKKTEYPVTVLDKEQSFYQIFSIEKVIGYMRGTAEEREYIPFDHYKKDLTSFPVFKMAQKESPVQKEPEIQHGSLRVYRNVDTYLSLTYPEHAQISFDEILSTSIKCTDGILPDYLKTGDISQPTESSPEFMEFSNITQPTQNISAPVGKNVLWRLLSHLYLNFQSLSEISSLKSVLNIYLFEECRNRYANQIKINEGIVSIKTKNCDRFVNGGLRRGVEIILEARHDKFASIGDLYLFGSILDIFFSKAISINTFTQLTIIDIIKKEFIKWPARIGDRTLI